MGYARAGFDVYAIDSNPKAVKANPFDGHAGDALEALADPAFLAGFDVIHASPPCQTYSITKHSHDRDHPDLYQPVRDALAEWAKWGGLWVIENVPGVPMLDALTLCGSMFPTLQAWDPRTQQTLHLRRHRLFESNVFLWPPADCDHSMPVGGVYGGGSTNHNVAKYWNRRGGYCPSKTVQQQLMGIDWMTHRQLNQAIPPAFTEWIGAQLLEHVNPRLDTPQLLQG